MIYLIKRFLKKIFCKHLWQDITKTFLRERHEPYGELKGITMYHDFKYYGIKQKCIRCNHERIISKRIIVI